MNHLRVKVWLKGYISIVGCQIRYHTFMESRDAHHRVTAQLRHAQGMLQSHHTSPEPCRSTTGDPSTIYRHMSMRVHLGIVRTV